MEEGSSYRYLPTIITDHIQIAFNFVDAETCPSREDAIYFGESFRNVSKFLRERGHEVIYHYLEGLLDSHTSGWNFLSGLKRDFSSAVASKGTCSMSAMPGELAKFWVPPFDMVKRSPLERGISCARLHLPEYYHIIIRDLKDDGSTMMTSKAFQELVPTYEVSQAEEIPVRKQVLFLLLCCALELDLSTEEHGILDKLVRRFDC